MYLTRLRLKITDRAAQRVLSDPYRLHQLILLAFDPSRPGGGERVLFRVEPEVREGEVRVLIQSETEPSWTRAHLSEQLPRLVVDGPKPLGSGFTTGQSLRFRLRGNPTKRTVEGKRVALKGESAQLDWVRRKLAYAGFEVEACRCRDEGMIQGRSGHRNGAGILLMSVLYEGLLRVRDPHAAIGAIAAGIGSGKAFGFGLLSVSRA